MDFNTSTQSLLTSANPAVNNLAAQMQAFDVDREAARGRLAAAQADYLSRSSARALPSASALAFRQQLAESLMSPAAQQNIEQAPPQASFLNSIGRGVDQLQQSLYGFAAQVGDMAGSKDLRNWGLLGAYANEDQIAANPRAVPSISDIHSVGDFGNWALETLGEQVPNLGLSIGTALATGGASLAAGLPAAAARSLGTAGFYGTVMAPESGSAYLRDFEKHGTNTSPWLDLGVGGINAALETAGSVTGSVTRGLLGKIVGKPVTEETTKAARGALTQFMLNRLSGGMREGGTEAAQEITQMLNERFQDGELGKELTKQDIMRIADSFAAGAVLGAPFSMFESHSAKKQGDASAPDRAGDFRQKDTADLLARFSGQASEQQVLNLADASRAKMPTAFEFGTPDNSFLSQFAPNTQSMEYFDNTPDQFLQQTPTVTPYSGMRDPSALMQEAARKQQEAGYAQFAATPDQFLQQTPQVTPWSPAPFNQSVDNGYTNQYGVTPTDFAATPDQFLQQQPQVTPAKAGFEQAPDAGYLNQYGANPTPFEQRPDQFLGQNPRVIPNVNTPATTQEILSGQTAALGMSRETALTQLRNNFEPLISGQTEAVNKAQDKVALLQAESIARKQQVIDAMQSADPITKRQLSKVLAGMDAQAKEATAELIKAQAQHTAMQQQFHNAQEQVSKLYDARERKFSNNLLTAQETTRQQLVSKDASYFGAIQDISDKTKELGAGIANQINQSLTNLRAKIAELRSMADSPRSGLSPDEIRRVRKQIRSAEANMLDLSGKMKKAAKLTDTIMQRTNDPAKFYNSILEARSDFSQLVALQAVAESVGAESVTSKVEAPVVDKAAELLKAIEQKRAAGVQQQQQQAEQQPTAQATAQKETPTQTEAKPTPTETVAPVQEAPTAPVQEAPVQETPVEPVQKPVSALAKRFADVRAEQAKAIAQAKERPANVQVISSISKHVTAFTNKFKGLSGKITTVWQAPAEHLRDLGYIDQNGNVVLIASNLEDYARTKGISLKDVVTATIQHEGFSHYGLRTVFDNAGLSVFLTNVRSSLSDSPAWKALEASSETFRNLPPLRQAEEFCSVLAEHALTADKLGKPEQSAWTKLKSTVKTALTKLGFISENKLLGNQNTNITEKDIIQILTKGATNLTQEGAQRKADISSDMGRAIDYSSPEMQGTALAKAAEDSNKSMLNKIVSAVSVFTDKDKRGEVRNYLYDRMVDSNDPVRRLVNSVKQLGELAGGRQRVDMANNVFKHLQVLNNKTVVQLDQAHAELVEPLLKAINKLREGGDTAQVAFEKASMYLEAQHSLERNAYARERGYTQPMSNIPDSVAKARVEALSSPIMDEVSAAMQKINNARLNMIVEQKLIPNAAEVVAAWRGAYKYYVPFKGWEDMVKVLDPAWYNSDTRRSINTPSAQKAITKRATGKDHQSQNVIAHGVAQMYDIIYLSNKAEVGRSLLDLARVNEDATDILELVKTKKTDPEESFGVHARVNSKTGEVTWINNTHSATEEMAQTVAVIDKNGDMQRVIVKDVNAARALRGENMIQSHPIIKAIGSVQNVMARYVTALNPLFWLRNPFRDTFSAILNMRSVETELRNLGIPSSKDIAASLFKKGLMGSFSKNSVRQALYHYYSTHDMSFKDFSDEVRAYMGDLGKFLEYGGQTEYFTQTSYNAVKKDLVTALKDMNPENRLQKGQAIARNMVEHMSHISDSLENMTRYIAFKEMVDSIKANNKQVGPGLWQRADGKLLHENEIYSRAANVALNLTVNFGMKGSWAPVMNSLYMFSSASIAGNTRMLEAILRKDPVTGKIDAANFAKFMMIPVMAYFAQATLCRALMPDDDDGINKYDKIAEFEKNGNFIIPGPNGSHLTIPLPVGYNALWTIGRNIVDCVMGKANGIPGPSVTKAAWSSITSMFDTFNPTGNKEEGINMFIPTVFRPLIQLAENKNFAGNPIKPEGNEYVKGEVPEHQKYWSTMNESVVKLCKGLYQATGLDVSPESLEHLVTSYTGGLGRIVTQTLARMDDWQRGKPTDFGKVPGLNVFYKTPQDSDTSAIFSTLRTQVLTQNTNAETARKDMTLSPAERIKAIQDNAAGLRLKSALDNAQVTLNDLRKRERALDNSNLSNEAKQQQLQSIKEAKTRVMMQFNKRAIDAGVNEIQK